MSVLPTMSSIRRNRSAQLVASLAAVAGVSACAFDTVESDAAEPSTATELAVSDAEVDAPAPVDVSAIPADAILIGECEANRAVVAAGEHAMNDFGPVPRYTPADLTAGVFDLVAIGRVVEVHSPLRTSPRPGNDVVAENGLDPAAFDIDVTPLTIELSDVLVGDPTSSTVRTFELGCLQQGANAATTPGSDVLLFADEVPGGGGYDEVTSSNYRMRDWMPFTDGVTVERIGVLGEPALAPALLGLTRDEVVALFR